MPIQSSNDDQDDQETLQLNNEFLKLRSLQFQMGAASQDFVHRASVVSGSGGAGSVSPSAFELRTGLRFESSFQEHQVNEYIKEQVLTALRDLTDRLVGEERVRF